MPPKAVPPGGREVTRKKRRRREREAKKAKRLASQRGRRGSAETLRGQFGGAKEAGLEVSRARRPLSRGSKQRFMKARINIEYVYTSVINFSSIPDGYALRTSTHAQSINSLLTIGYFLRSERSSGYCME